MLLKKHVILVAEDDPDDKLMLTEAFSESNIINKLTFVENGEELLKYLYGAEQYQNRQEFPFPSIIILDLNMPKIDGREALKKIKSDKKLCTIPIIIFTTSDAERDINMAYENGVNCYITKPDSFSELKDIAKQLNHYWLEIVTIPDCNELKE